MMLTKNQERIVQAEKYRKRIKALWPSLPYLNALLQHHGSPKIKSRRRAYKHPRTPNDARRRAVWRNRGIS